MQCAHGHWEGKTGPRWEAACRLGLRPSGGGVIGLGAKMAGSITTSLESLTQLPRLGQAYGDWLRGFAWRLFGTFTFTRQASLDSAVDRFRRLIGRLEQRAEGPVPWYLVVEPHIVRSHHVHALLDGPGCLSCQTVKEAWTWGRRHVVVYDPSLGAAHYLSKAVSSPFAFHDISQRLPKRLPGVPVPSR